MAGRIVRINYKLNYKQTWLDYFKSFLPWQPTIHYTIAIIVPMTNDKVDCFRLCLGPFVAGQGTEIRLAPDINHATVQKLIDFCRKSQLEREWQLGENKTLQIGIMVQYEKKINCLVFGTEPSATKHVYIDADLVAAFEAYLKYCYPIKQ